MGEKYQICLGHLSSRNKRCPGCIADEFNEQCPDYKEINIYRIKISEEIEPTVDIPVHTLLKL